MPVTKPDSTPATTPSCEIPVAAPPRPERRGGLAVGDFERLLPDQLAIDIRALAAFRVGLGLLVLVDVLNRSRFLGALYTDAGVLPRAALATMQNPYHLSLHLMSGVGWFQVVLAVATGVAALALMAGVRTRLMTVVCWVLLVSVHTRNPYMLQSGDTLLRLFLFWAMFLPLGAAWSVDRALDRSGTAPELRQRTVPAMALLIQVVLVYLTTALFKMHPVWYTEGRAVQHALMLDQYTTPLGRWMLNFPEVLRFSTYGTLLLEIVVPVALLTRWLGDRARVLLVALMIGFHLSFVLLMTLGLFPFISVLGWLVFLPSSFWSRIGALARSPYAARVVIHYDGDCGFCVKMLRMVQMFLALGEVRATPAQADPAVETEMRARNSWLVDTHDGRRLDRFDGLVYLMRVSRVGAPLGAVLGTAPLRAVGNLVYAAVASRRTAASWLFQLFPWRTRGWRTRRVTEAVAMVALGYVVAWNVAGMDRFTQLPDSIRWVGHALRLEQRWVMFSPFPYRDSGGWEARGVLEDGSELELTPTVQHARPYAGVVTAGVMDGYTSYRWRKYAETMRRNRRLAEPYVRHLCAAWPREHPAEAPLTRVELAYVYRRTLHQTHTRSDWQRDELLALNCHDPVSPR